MTDEIPVEDLKQEEKTKKTWTEEVEMAGSELVDRVRELLQEGNVRRLIIRNSKGDRLLEVPLTAGVAVGGVMTLWNPVLAALGAMAALLADVRVEIIRSDDGDQGSGETS